MNVLDGILPDVILGLSRKSSGHAWWTDFIYFDDIWQITFWLKYYFFIFLFLCLQLSEMYVHFSQPYIIPYALYIWCNLTKPSFICRVAIGASMMTSWSGNIFRDTGQRRGDLMFFICAWKNGWANNRETADLRHHRAHYDGIVMKCYIFFPNNSFINASVCLSVHRSVYMCLSGTILRAFFL